eukprot:3499367-Pleurochrysis_carterae.AAC.1
MAPAPATLQAVRDRLCRPLPTCRTRVCAHRAPAPAAAAACVRRARGRANRRCREAATARCPRSTSPAPAALRSSGKSRQSSTRRSGDCLMRRGAAGT